MWWIMALMELMRVYQAEDASDEACIKHWNGLTYLLVFSPQCPRGSEDLQIIAEE